MDISELLLIGGGELKELDNPKLEAGVLLANVLKKGRTFVKSHPEEKISKKEQKIFLEFVQQRKERVPVAYILGFKFWSGLKIKATKDVLIPRDETEMLVQKICSLKRDAEVKSILDIGTGSGNIAIFLAKNFPKADVLALDNSPKALKVAGDNINTLKVSNIKLRESNLLSEVLIKSSFDLIIANLPYVSEEIKVSSEVQKEPREAIFAGKDGLDLIRELASQIENKHIRFGELWLEFLPFQKEEITNIFKSHQIDFFPDLDGEIRFSKIF